MVSVSSILLRHPLSRDRSGVQVRVLKTAPRLAQQRSPTASVDQTNAESPSHRRMP